MGVYEAMQITERQLDKIWHGNAMRVLAEQGGEINESSCL